MGGERREGHTIWDDVAFLQAVMGDELREHLVNSCPRRTHAFRILLIAIGSSWRISWSIPRCGAAVQIWSNKGRNINKSFARAMFLA